MATYILTKAIFDKLTYNLDDAIASYKQALEDHKLTEGVPAPTATALVTDIVRVFDGAYEIFDDNPPPSPDPPPTPEQVSAEARAQTFIADPVRADLLTRLQNATPAQIDTWLQNNVTNLAQARAVLAAIIKILATFPPNR